MINFENIDLGGNVKTQETNSYIYFYDVTKENPITRKDYPWGRREKTERRFWIDTNKRGEQRMVYQSKNPKTGRWCAEKKMTYSFKRLIVIEKETGRVKSTGVYKGDGNDLRNFREFHREFLSSRDIKDLDEQIMIISKVDEYWQDMEKKAKERQHTINHLDLKSKMFWTKDEIVKSTDDIELYEVYLQVYGIKKRCRKADHEHLTLGYVPSQFFTIDDIVEKVDNLIPITLKENMKAVSKAQLRVLRHSYQAPRDGSIFFSFKCSPFELDYNATIEEAYLQLG